MPATSHRFCLTLARCLAALLPGCAPLRATDLGAPGTLETEIRDGANFARAAFRLWLPPGVATVRTTLVVVPGSNADGRAMADDAVWRAFAAEHELALVACWFTDRPHAPDFIEDYVAAARGSGQALLDALENFAARSHRPELAHVPLLLWGMSAGGEFNYEFAAWKPERVLAFVANKGGIYYTALVPTAARAVPALLFTGERDLAARTDVLKGLFALNRRAGALWALVPEPGVAHEEGRSRDLSLLFFAELLPLRLGPPGTPLRALGESDGILGTAAGGPFSAAGRTVSTEYVSSWLPTSRVADAWRAVTTGAPFAGTTGGSVSPR